MPPSDTPHGSGFACVSTPLTRHSLAVAGAGKTSTLKILSGDQLPTAGTAHVGGLNVLENQRAVRQLIGYCKSAVLR
jgi:ABC-type uncharacterized transport system ATPase subunit